MSTTLHSAKALAVERYLKPAKPARAFRATAVSSRPEHNVVGVGIGPKVVNNQSTPTRAVRFYVERKLPKAAVSGANMLPASLDGVPTDVIETDRFVAGSPAAVLHPAAPAAAISPRSRMRPAQPGCSVGFAFTGNEAGMVMAGTLGAIVRNGESLFILSNNHVLANENALPLGAPIFQPGLLDGGDPGSDEIAALYRFVPLTASAENLVDCAIAVVSDLTIVSPEILPNVGPLRTPAPLAATENEAVEKTGRTTGYTQGIVTDVSATIAVQYETLGVLTFDDQILIEGTGGPFSAAGDSGSLIVDRNQKQAVGLLFAGSPSHTIANKIGNVLSALNLSIVV